MLFGYPDLKFVFLRLMLLMNSSLIQNYPFHLLQDEVEDLDMNDLGSDEEEGSEEEESDDE